MAIAALAENRSRVIATDATTLPTAPPTASRIALAVADLLPGFGVSLEVAIVILRR
ncbi:MAG: hypothetical protein JO264_19355 [Acidisphaera sp.]|nr:hypothetical protein [Acidisphaera sp.]